VSLSQVPTERIHCNTCKGETIHARPWDDKPRRQFEVGPDDFEFAEAWHAVLRCKGCETVSYRTRLWHSIDDQTDDY
jgi:hypothetical protein